MSFPKFGLSSENLNFSTGDKLSVCVTCYITTLYFYCRQYTVLHVTYDAHVVCVQTCTHNSSLVVGDVTLGGFRGSEPLAELFLERRPGAVCLPPAT